MPFVLNNLALSPLNAQDAEAVYQCLQDKEISETTLRIPYPYTLQNAHTWLEDNSIFEEENGFRRNHAIRLDGKFIGAIGVHFNYGAGADKSEFGYWLGKAYWNQGIMTEAIKKFSVLAKAYFRLSLLEAHVFAQNISSQKVLLKNGFTKTGYIPRYHTKNGINIDAVRFEKRL